MILLAAGITAVHHLAFGLVLPLLIFPGVSGASFARVVLHAVIVLIETGVLAWVSWTVARAFDHLRLSAGELQAASTAPAPWRRRRNSPAARPRSDAGQR